MITYPGTTFLRARDRPQANSRAAALHFTAMPEAPHATWPAHLNLILNAHWI